MRNAGGEQGLTEERVFEVQVQAGDEFEGGARADQSYAEGKAQSAAAADGGQRALVGKKLEGKPGEKKPTAVTGFIVTKRGEMASNQGAAPVAHPASTATDRDIAVKAAKETNCRSRE